ncbi:MAG: septum site-determining protein MinC [Chloroflexaceae bacterium]|jgi:septum site-determining protein MinC|nr:septum site-determining protein MinC [Chloroflexaceae bacterium]
MSDLVSIKGGRDGIRMTLDAAAPWDDLLKALEYQLDQSGAFLSGAKVTVDVGDRPVTDQQLAAMLALMQQHAVQPESLVASARESRNAARSAGIIARPVPARPLTQATGPEAEALFLGKTLRSGQVVQFAGHITLIGDVNAGAELIAGGNVVVWGRLRGVVHAGALGDRTSMVCALELTPTQLRIADLITRPPAGKSGGVPEYARIENNLIVVDPWIKR